MSARVIIGIPVGRLVEITAVFPHQLAVSEVEAEEDAFRRGVADQADDWQLYAFDGEIDGTALQIRFALSPSLRRTRGMTLEELSLPVVAAEESLLFALPTELRRDLKAAGMSDKMKHDAGSLADAGQLAGLGEGLGRIAGARPFVLALEQHVEEAEIPLRVGAAGQHGSLERRPVEREVTKHQLDLAGVDKVLLELRQRIGVEAGAMRAGQGGVFQDRDRRVGIAQHALAQGVVLLGGLGDLGAGFRLRLGQLGLDHLGRLRRGVVVRDGPGLRGRDDFGCRFLLGDDAGVHEADAGPNSDHGDHGQSQHIAAQDALLHTRASEYKVGLPDRASAGRGKGANQELVLAWIALPSRTSASRRVGSSTGPAARWMPASSSGVMGRWTLGRRGAPGRGPWISLIRSTAR